MQMAALDSLDSSIQLSPISVDTKCEILQVLWDFDVNPGDYYNNDLDYDVYFSYYTEQCADALHDGGRHVSVRTHRDVIDIARDIKASLVRDRISQTVRAKFSIPKPANEDELVDGSIDLVARLLLMVEFGCLQYGFTGRKQLAWTEGTVEECIGDHFGAPRNLGQENVKLERIFNARNLGRIAGIEIEWTKNLADHLKLLDEDKKVAIFNHASFLECQLKNPLFPASFVEETIRTIALLFPQNDKQNKKWFKKISSSLRLDSKAIRCGRLRAEDRHIENFEFWHDRLVILKQVFDEAEPSTLSQWWCDRRKRVQWYTFWVAAVVLALTIFFGLIQCVEGALQVYKAFNP